MIGKNKETAAPKDAKPAGAAPEMEAEGVPADLLNQAGGVPSGVTLEAFDPMEKIPTLAVGHEWLPGRTIAGFYEETQVIASPKFVHSKERNEKGVPVQYRHVLRIGSPTGTRLGIWTTAELKNVFEKLTPGTFISILYKNKGLNAKNQQQHFFEYKKQVAQ